MTLPISTTIAASQINSEFGRGGQMSIWYARNGYYGGINDAANDQSANNSKDNS